ncbi:hypothetical protein ACHAXS_005342 [Conticribra weissflogii]
MLDRISKIPSLLDNDSDDVSAADLCQETGKNVAHSALAPISCTNSATSSCSSTSHLSTEEAFKIATLFPDHRPKNGSYNQHRSKRRRRPYSSIFREDRPVLGRVESIYSNQTDSSGNTRREQKEIRRLLNESKIRFSDKFVERSAPLDSKIYSNKPVNPISNIDTKSTNLVAKFIRQKSIGILDKKRNKASSKISGNSRAPLRTISLNRSCEMSKVESLRLGVLQKEVISCWPETKSSQQSGLNSDASNNEIITNKQNICTKRRLDTSNDSGDVFEGCSSSSDNDTCEERSDKSNNTKILRDNIKPLTLTTTLNKQGFHEKDEGVIKRRKRSCIQHVGHRSKQPDCKRQSTDSAQADTREELRLTHSLLDDSMDWNSEDDDNDDGDESNKNYMTITNERLNNVGGKVDNFGSRINTNNIIHECRPSIPVSAGRSHSVGQIFRKPLQKSHVRGQLIGNGQNDKLFEHTTRYVSFPRKSGVAPSLESLTVDKEVKKPTLDQPVCYYATSNPSSRTSSENFPEMNDHELNRETKAESRTSSFASVSFQAVANGLSSRDAIKNRNDGNQSEVSQSFETSERCIHRDARCIEEGGIFTSSYPINIELTEQERAKKIFEELIASKKEIRLLQEKCSKTKLTERRRSSQIQNLEAELATAKSEALEVVSLRRMVDSLLMENRSLRSKMLSGFNGDTILNEKNNFEIRRELHGCSHDKLTTPTTDVSMLAFSHIEGTNFKRMHPTRSPSRQHVIQKPNSSPSSNQRDNEEKLLESNECSICFRIAGGAMKSCQCDKSSCTKRAHVACIACRKASKFVSYPGTPSPATPTILCDRVWDEK